jgi:hypothetical protein
MSTLQRGGALGSAQGRRRPAAPQQQRPVRRWQALAPVCVHKEMRQQHKARTRPQELESAADTTLEILGRFRKAELDR